LCKGRGISASSFFLYTLTPDNIMPLLAPYRRKVPKEAINELPLRHYSGPIRLVNCSRSLEHALSCIKGETLLGFDTETRPAFRKGEFYLPSLLQLAARGEVFLFHLKTIGFPDPVRDLLADTSVIKTGVAVRDDITGLQKLNPFQPGSFIDLGEVARQKNIPTRGLRTIAANFLSFRLSKGAQRSNWGAPELDAKQQTYAATDAWVSRKIHLRFEELGML